MKLPTFQYKGKHNEAYHANAYSLKCISAGFIVLLFCWILDILGIFIVDLTIMNTAAISAAVVCLAAYLYAFFVGIDSQTSCYVIMFLLVAFATIICTELAYHTTMFMIFPLVCSSQYFDKKISWFTAIATCAGIAFSVMIGYRIGLCDSNMLLLTYTTSATHVAELLAGTFTINTDKSLMFLFFVFPRWLILLALMPLLNHIAKDIQEHTAREVMARHMAEVDGLTGINNRTKYLQDLANYYPSKEKISVLFFDINNLKSVNDTRGHEYGDVLICGLAEILSDAESDTRRAYRLGGDEFIMILFDEAAGDAEAFCVQMQEAFKNKILEKEVYLSVAVGIAYGKGSKLESVVKEADERMYKCKLEMKQA